MQQAPFDEKYESDLHIYTHNLSITDTHWEMDSSDNERGTALSGMWTYWAAFTDIPHYKQLVTDVVLILRNQSDYSNVIMIVGTFSIHSLFERIGGAKMLLRLTEYLFEKGREFAKETDLMGADGKYFIMPSFHYTEDCFRGKTNEE